jgi:hypothetical protein
MEGSGHLHAPAALPPRYPINITPVGSRTSAVQPTARRYADWADPSPPYIFLLVFSNSAFHICGLLSVVTVGDKRFPTTDWRVICCKPEPKFLFVRNERLQKCVYKLHHNFSVRLCACNSRSYERAFTKCYSYIGERFTEICQHIPISVKTG